jgi:predicted NAD-dependent protein-ADP-ribosyltransferase YbiA (DUF1768 family)
LEEAVRNNDLECVKKLVKSGANIYDTDHLLFSNNLFAIASPEIKRYFELLKDDKVYIQDFTQKYIIVRGNTSKHSELLRKQRGRFIQNLRGGKGWLVPIKYRNTLEEILKEPKISESKIVESKIEEVKEEFKIEEPQTRNIYSSSIPRPVVKDKKLIELYTVDGEYGYMTIGFTLPNLVNIGSYSWDSIERYLMYKMYEGSYKGNAIRDADSLCDAYKYFKVDRISLAKTPKQLVINQRLKPLAESKINVNYFHNPENLFYKANKDKFTQNKLLATNLLKTGNANIINKNSLDIFGYEGNLLGNTLMKIRSELNEEKFINPQKTNSMIIEKYIGNKNFYVIRGDPDQDLAREIRALGTYKTKNGKIIHGKLNLNLQKGAGWLIPKTKAQEAKELVFETFPDEKKIQISGHKWVKNRIRPFIDIAILFSGLRGHQEVTSDDAMFSIKDSFGAEEFLGQDNGEPSQLFKYSIQKYASLEGAVLSDATVKLFWDFISKMVADIFRDVNKYQDLRKIIDKLEETILDISIRPVEGLSERESIITNSFIRIYKLLQRLSDKDAKTCVIAVHMIVGNKIYADIREIYSKKAKIQSDSEYPDAETEFRKRFRIKSPHIAIILQLLPRGISKKCQLLLLTSLDYIIDLEGEDAIAISKRLIILSQKGRQPSPTPQESIPNSNPNPIVEESTNEVEKSAFI